jgi:hypothetical protein
VLFTGGAMLTYDTDIYEPGTRTFRAGPYTNYERSGGSLTLLPDGRVLVAGGMGTLEAGGDLIDLTVAELYTP